MNFNSWFLLPSCFASNSILRFRSSGLSLKYWLTRWPKIAPKNHREDINTISTTRFFLNLSFSISKIFLPSFPSFFVSFFFFRFRLPCPNLLMQHYNRFSFSAKERKEEERENFEREEKRYQKRDSTQWVESVRN